MLLYPVILVLFLFPRTGYCQRAEKVRVDSLLNELNHSRTDTQRARLLDEVAFAFFAVDPKMGLAYGRQGLALGERLHSGRAIAGAYNALGADYWAMNDFILSQDNYLHALKINEQRNDTTEMARNLHNLGIIYQSLDDAPRAIGYLQKALQLDEAIHNRPVAMGCLSNIAQIYQDKKELAKALDYCRQSLQIAEELGGWRDIAFMSGRLASIYTDSGVYTKAMEYARHSLRTFERAGDIDDAMVQLSDIGGIYWRMGNSNDALSCYKKALDATEKLTGRTAEGNAARYANAMGGIYFQSGSAGSDRAIRLRQAETYLKRSLQLAGNAPVSAVYGSDLAFLADVYKAQGRDDLALGTYQRYMRYKDSLMSSQRDKEMTRRELEFEYGLQMDTLNYLKQLQHAKLVALDQEERLTKLAVKQHWLYAILVIIALTLIGSFMLLRYRIQQLRLKNEIHRVTLSALRSQMNPHFMFNALNTIQSYVYANDRKSAATYLGKFSELMRKVLDGSNKQSISLEEELEVLGLYLSIEQARFGDKLEVEIQTDPRLHMENIMVPPMLIQPYVENAVKHGLLHIANQKKLSISIQRSKDPHYLDIVIDDNGIGREKSAQLNGTRLEHRSFANRANAERIRLFNQLHSQKAILEITDKKNPDGSSAGTTVTIRLPVDAVSVA